MKKLFALVLVFVLIVSLCACDNQQSHNGDNPTTTKYKLTVIDYWGYLVEPLDEYYVAGEEVEVHLAFLSGPSVGINLNGEYIGENSTTKYDGVYPVITFTMPAKDSVLYTTQNGYIGYESTFSRAGSERDIDIYNGSLNADRLNDDNTRHLPVYKFDTLADLEKFKSDFGGESGFNYDWDEVPSLNDATAKYDDAFFAQNTLMLVYIDTNSDSYRFGFKSVSLNGNYFCIHVEQTNNPQVVTDDMAAWFITVAVPDSMIANCIEFDADLSSVNDTTVVPEDFSFALTWNVFGISSYDSQTGRLVKTTDATNPDDYVTYYQLTDEDKEYIYNLIVSLDVNSYPDVYDPQNGSSDPDATLILIVRVNGDIKTIKAEHISLIYISKDEKGQHFLSTCEAISDKLMATDEWKALPDYESLYE